MLFPILAAGFLAALIVMPGCGRDRPAPPTAPALDVKSGYDPADPADPAPPGLYKDTDRGGRVPPGLADRPELPPGLTRRPVPWGSDEESADPAAGDEILVELEEGASLETVLNGLPAAMIEALPELEVIKVVPLPGTAVDQLIRQLQRKVGVLSVEQDRRLQSPESRGMTVSFNDGEFDEGDFEQQEWTTRLRLDAAHGISRGQGVRVAILDTGADPGHPALAGRLVAGRDLVDNDDTPWESANGLDDDGDGAVDEAHGHGTHVAGLVALVAPDAEILVYRVLDAEGWGTASRIAQGIVRAVHDGARVINLSLGMYDPFRSIEKAIDFAVERGVAVVVSAGNDGVMDPGQFPALYPRALAIGSVNDADALSSFSNFGPEIFVTAPGEGLVSAYPNGGYAAATGTSMSAAVATGAAALVLALEEDEDHDEMCMTRLQRAMELSVAPGTGMPGMTGLGRIDFLRAVSR